MNIYNFFNSPDIAKHCKQIKHEFSPLDMAVIVAHSSKPAKEIKEALKYIAESFPDMPIHRTLHLDAQPSLHEYLQKLISHRSNSKAFDNGLELLKLIFIHIPVPFKKGDLVTLRDGHPCVLYDLPHWWTGKYSYEEFLSGKHGDGSDMCVTLYSFYNHGDYGILFRDHGPPYCLTELRYFKGELTGQDRFLKYLSQYIKNEDDCIDWLINVFLKFKADAEQKECSELFGSWYFSLDKEKEW